MTFRIEAYDRFRMTPLRAFLQMTMLSTDTETAAESKEDEPKKDVRTTIVDKFRSNQITIIESHAGDVPFR